MWKLGNKLIRIYILWFLLILVSGSLLVMYLTSQQLDNLKFQAQQLQLNLQQAKTQAALLPTVEQQQQKLVADIEQALPDVTDTISLVIDAIAQKAQLTLETTTPSSDIVVDHHTETLTKISAVGNYQQLLIFLEQLQHTKALLVPEAMAINVVDNKLKIALTLNYYQHFTDLLQPLTSSAIAVLPNLPAVNFISQRNPFLPPVTHPWRTVIMSGVLIVNKKNLALLQLADGSMIAVRAGDRFSDYQTVIQQVTSHYVVLTQALPTADGIQTVTQTVNLLEAKSAP